jgi:hypothetical protein
MPTSGSINQLIELIFCLLIIVCYESWRREEKVGFPNHNLIMFLTPYVEMELQQKPTLILES